MKDVRTFRATATRSGRWWSVELHDLPEKTFGFTQGKDLGEAEFMARDAIATLLNIPVGKVAVILDVPVVAPITARLEEARQARLVAAEREQETLTEVARELTARGMTRKDVGALLGLSAQRIQQVVKAA